MQRGTLLVAAGLASEAVYLAATMRLSWWRYGGTLNRWSQLLGGGWQPLALCLAGVGMLLAAYLWGWRLVHVGQASVPSQRWIVWGFAVLFAVTLFWLMPITADLFTYLSQAHLFTDLGANPLQVAPLQFVDDPLLAAYLTPYSSRPTVYGPTWLLLSALGTGDCPFCPGQYGLAGGVFYLKGLAVVAYLGCAWLVERIVRQVRPALATEALYFFAWNPLVLLMGVGDGHNDIMMMAAVLLAMWLLLHGRWMFVVATWTLSVWIKVVAAIFFLPLAIYAWQQWVVGGRITMRPYRTVRPYPGTASGLCVQVCVSACVLVGVSTLVLAPFWPPEGLSADASWLAGFMERLIRPINWGGGVPAGLPGWALGMGLLTFAVAYGFLAWRLARGPVSFEEIMEASFVVALLAFLLAAARTQPWHLIWPAALAGLSKRRWAWPVVAGLSAAMLVGQIWIEWGAPGINP